MELNNTPVNWYDKEVIELANSSNFTTDMMVALREQEQSVFFNTTVEEDEVADIDVDMLDHLLDSLHETRARMSHEERVRHQENVSRWWGGLMHQHYSRRG